jgi:hypothetical protein
MYIRHTNANAVVFHILCYFMVFTDVSEEPAASTFGVNDL